MKKMLFKLLPVTRRKASFILLLLYWPAIFVLTHIFLPQSVLLQMKASDKALHFLVYFILAVLLWFSISIDKKASLRSKKFWLVFLLLVIYAAADEWLQGVFAGRTRDFMDFVWNVCGVAAGLVIVLLFSFRPAVLVAAGISILVFTNAVRIQFTGHLAFIRPAFLLLSLGFFTFFWCRILTSFQPLKQSCLKWLAASAALPALLVAAVKILTFIMGRNFELTDFLLSAAAILTVIVIMFFIKGRFANSIT